MKASYILRRLVYSAAAFGVSASIAFFILHLMPGDYITQYLEQIYIIAPPDIVQAYNQVYGLDRPLIEQYFDYISGIVFFNWGYSLIYSQPVFDVIINKLIWTLIIFIPATILSIIAGIALGAYSGWKHGSRIDITLLNGMIFLRAIPSYWLALMVLLIFAYYLGLFPMGGYVGFGALDTGIDPIDVLNHAILPIFVLFLIAVTGIYYLMRNSMLMTIGEDYITTARAKGLDDMTILRKHAMKNAMLPMVTSISLQCAAMLSGSIFVETVFSWPGLGMLTYEAIRVRDIPLLQGILLMDTLIVIFANIGADLVYHLIDPRVEVGEDAAN